MFKDSSVWHDTRASEMVSGYFTYRGLWWASEQWALLLVSPNFWPEVFTDIMFLWIMLPFWKKWGHLIFIKMEDRLAVWEEDTMIRPEWIEEVLCLAAVSDIIYMLLLPCGGCICPCSVWALMLLQLLWWLASHNSSLSCPCTLHFLPHPPPPKGSWLPGRCKVP